MSHSAVISNNKMIIVSGTSDSGNSNDIWSFDFTTKAWTEISLDDENIETEEYTPIKILSKELIK